VPSSKNITLEDVTIAFRNFEGKEDKFNAAGNRNFAILLDEDRAVQMERDGWNVKRLKPRDDDEIGPPYIQVAVSYKQKPPRIGVVTSGGIKYYSEDLVDLLDWVDIETADVTLYPYEWGVNGKTGIKAYLVTLFMKIEEDYLQLKWESYVEENVKQIGYTSTENDIIDAEFYEVRGEIEAATA
jgi:hypothetical protein